MEAQYTISLSGADHLPADRRIALETRYAKELEGFLGSPKTIKEHLVASAIVMDCDVDGERPPGDTRQQTARLDRAMEAAAKAVWASMGEVPGAAFHLTGR